MQRGAIIPIVILNLLSALICCSSQPKIPNGNAEKIISAASPSPRAAVPETAQQSVIDCIQQLPFLDRGDTSGMLRAWRRVPNYQNYRMVETADLTIPGETGDEHARSWSHDYGELSGAYGLALFVVDKAISSPDRFSVAVLVKRPNERYDLYWTYQKKDLSHFIMGRHSGDVYLEEHSDDGKTHVCDLQYSRKQNRWACEFYD